MIKEILPLTELKLNILAELYQRDLNLKNLEIKTGSLKQTLFKTLKLMENILEKNNNVYSIKPKYRKLLEKLLLQALLEKRLKEYFILIELVRKYYNPKKMYLFGSFARGDNNQNSDIDIYVISDISEKENYEFRSKFSKSLKREIQIISINPNVHLTNDDKYSELYEKISNDIKEGIEVNLDCI